LPLLLGDNVAIRAELPTYAAVRFCGATSTDETVWPRKRTLALFREWFTVELHSVVEDLCDYKLVDDED
jgi:hypothetical protein